jgi:hypothetical protein
VPKLRAFPGAINSARTGWPQFHMVRFTRFLPDSLMVGFPRALPYNVVHRQLPDLVDSDVSGASSLYRIPATGQVRAIQTLAGDADEPQVRYWANRTRFSQDESGRASTRPT